MISQSFRVSYAAVILVLVVYCHLQGCSLPPLAPLTTPKSEQESATEQVDTLLQAVIRHSTGAMPTNDPRFPSYLWVHETCWAVLQTAMRESKNSYTVQLVSVDDSRFNQQAVRAYTDITFNVVFQHGTVITILYSQGGIAGCSETTSSIEQSPEP